MENNTVINFRTKRDIPQDLMDVWKLKMYHTSYIKIQAATGLSRVTVSEVFSSGKATQRVLDILTSYFNTIELPA